MTQIAALGPRAATLATATRIARTPPDAQSFHRAMSDEERRTRANVRRASEDLVAQAFVMPILEQLRATNHAAKPFGTSDAEKRLGPVADGHVAHAMVQRSRFEIVDRVESSILRRSGLAPMPSPTPRVSAGVNP